MPTLDDQIKRMYDSNLASQKEQLAQDYARADSELTAQKEQLQKMTNTNLNRTAVEAQKAAVNNSEYYAATGLSSGAKAQARVSQENQLQADMTALRAQQMAADAEVERQRSLLGQEYASAIRQAQADNDIAIAQALYERAQVEDERLNQQKLMQQQRQWQLEDTASTRAYEQELIAADRAWQEKQAANTATGPSQWEVAQFMAKEAGDYTLVGRMLGYDQAQIDKLNGVPAKVAATLAPMEDAISAAPPEQSYRTDNFIRELPSWDQISHENHGYESYDDYIAGLIANHWEKGNFTDGEAHFLINRYGLWNYMEDYL